MTALLPVARGVTVYAARPPPDPTRINRANSTPPVGPKGFGMAMRYLWPAILVFLLGFAIVFTQGREA